MKPWVNFRAVKQAVGLSQVLSHYQVDRLRRRAEGRWQGVCPIHRGRGDDSFHVDLNKNVFHCFSCQAGGGMLEFVAAMERCSVREAALRVQAWFGLGGPGPPPSPDGSPAAAESKLVRENRAAQPPLRFALRGVDPAHPYLVERGIALPTAVCFGVGWYSGPGLMSGRVVIPIQNEHGQTMAYAGRSIDGTPPKYKLPAGFRKSLLLFNLHRAVASGEKTVVVVEGYFDCLRVHQAGFPAVVALMGSSLSPSQQRLLLDRFERVVLMLDGDEAGRSASRAIASRLFERGPAVVWVPAGSQPDHLPVAAIQQLLRPYAAPG